MHYSLYRRNKANQEVDAILFYFGIVPLKIYTRVPFYTSLDVDDVPDLKDMVTGLFEFLATVQERDEALSIYIFKFASGKGCRKVTSPIHGLFHHAYLTK